MMSGYLIHRSIMSGHSVLQFLMNRNLRIFPGLWFMLLLTTLLLGLFVSTYPLPAFLQSRDTLLYVFGNAILYVPHQILPGVFDNNPMPAVNGSLWTLRFEYTCYLATLGLFVFGFFTTARRFLFFVSLFLAFYVVAQAAPYIGLADHSLLEETRFIPRFNRLFLAFLIGIGFSVFYGRYRLKCGHVLVAFALAFAASYTFLYEAAITAAMAAAIFYIAYLQSPLLVRLRHIPDISYGMYIYAFPVQQLLISIRPDMHPVWNSLLSILISAVPGSISWFYVEKPALSFKTLFGRLGAP